MNARELMTHLRTNGPISPAEYFLYLASHAHEARLNDGQRLNDLTDFTTFLLEVAQVLSGQQPSVRSRFEADHSCWRCGHPHGGDKECGFEIAPNRRCRCELEVPA